MCSICRCMPCDPRCPNASEPKALYECDGCGGMIYPGDQYWDNGDGEVYCRYCLDDMKAEDILELLGESLKTAGEDE